MQRDSDCERRGGAAARLREVIARDPDFDEIGHLIEMVRDVETAVGRFVDAVKPIGLSRTRTSALVAIALLQKASRSCRAFSEIRAGEFRFDRLALAALAMDEGADLRSMTEALFEDERELCAGKVDRDMAALLEARTPAHA